MLRRWLLLVLVVAGLAPGTFLRTPPPEVDLRSGVTIVSLEGLPRNVGPFEVLGVWQMASMHHYFGSYSALRATAPGRFLALSDKGDWLRFAVTADGPQPLGLGQVGGDEASRTKRAVDIEALAVDQRSGRLWLAYEGSNAIERRDADLSDPLRVRPAAMSQWWGNRGPEAMARLADGSFIVIGEGTRAWTGTRRPAVLFAGDPLAGAAAASFAFQGPGEFSPTDMAPLPDGRVLILLRNFVWGLPPRFEVGLMVADPSEIAAGETWTGQMLAFFPRSFPIDNYEGLNVEWEERGYPVTITLVSDDNDMRFQRTLLARLRWDGRPPVD